ncbi:MAG: hypothetical protein K6L60_03265 [Oceanobacter sp.]
MKTIQQAIWAVATAGTLTLTGCGGGGSSDSSDSGDDPQAVERVSLTGVAVKGVMANAIITITSLDGTTTYGTTRTDNSGRYSLADLNLGNTPVKVIMTTDGSTRLTCDSAIGCDNNGSLVAFGDTYAYHDPDFALSAVLPTAGTLTSVELMVTPLTHMAAERIAQAGATSAADIEGINRATASLLGMPNVDIIRETPLDITDAQDSQTASDAARRYGAIVASFATLAAKSGDSLDQVIDAVSDDYAVDGGLIANASDDTIDLESLFGAAADSADKAEDEGADLGLADVELRTNEQQASHAPEDEVVIAKDTSTPPADTLTQAQATQKAIDLLEAMNDWNTTLSSDTTEAATSAYIDQVDTLADLMPVIDEQSQTLHGLRELVVEESADGEQQDGLLLQHIDLIDQLVDLSSYIQSNHGNLSAKDNGDGTFTVSAQSLISSAHYLTIEQYLTRGSSNGNLPPADQADVTATYQLGDSNDPERIAQITFSGSNLVGTLESAELTYSLQSNSQIAYSLANMKVMGSEGEDFTASGSLSMTFANDTDRSTFLNDRDTDGSSPSLLPLRSTELTLDATQKGLTGPSIDPTFEQASADLDITLSANQNDTQTTDATLVVDVDLSSTQEGFIRGKLTTNIKGQHTQSGDFTAGFTHELALSEMDMAFEGSLQAKSDSGDTATFNGTATMAGSDFNDNDPHTQKLSLKGELGQTATSGAIHFDGDIAVQMTALKASDNTPVPGDDGLVMMPEQVSLAGTLKVRENSNEAVTHLSALLEVEGYDALSKNITASYPEQGEQLARIELTGFGSPTVNKSNNSAVVTLNNNLKDTIDTGLVTYLRSQGMNVTSLTRGSSVPATVTFTLRDCVAFTDMSGNSDCNLIALSESALQQSGTLDTRITLPTAQVSDPNDWINPVLERYTSESEVIVSYFFDEGSIDLQGTFSAQQLADFGQPDAPTYIDLTVQQITLDIEKLIKQTETDSAYLGMSLAADIDSRAPNLEDGNIRVAIERLGLKDASARMRFSYGPRDIDLVLDSIKGLTLRDATNLTIADADTRMVITAQCATQSNPDEINIVACDSGVDFAGDVFVGDIQVGSLEDRDGFPVFTFTDPNNSQYQLILTPNFLVQPNSAN